MFTFADQEEEFNRALRTDRAEMIQDTILTGGTTTDVNRFQNVGENKNGKDGLCYE